MINKGQHFPHVTDTDECEAAVCGTHINHACTNMPGSYSCACATGYDVIENSEEGQTCKRTSKYASSLKFLSQDEF